jgi:ribonuclease T2
MCLALFLAIGGLSGCQVPGGEAALRTSPPAAVQSVSPAPGEVASTAARPTKAAAARTPTAVRKASATARPAADFDYYLLSLSWSPEYCAAQNDSQSQQCQVGRRLGFVLHGLWPQNERGYPSNCTDQRLPSGLKQEFAGLFPAESLFNHEWEKHGTCSGLAPEAYLALAKQLKEALLIPAAYKSPPQPFRTTSDELRQEFSAANPGLESDGLGVYCSSSGRYLSELRICYTTDGQFRACSAEVLKNSDRSCGRSDFLVRNVR